MQKELIYMFWISTFKLAYPASLANLAKLICPTKLLSTNSSRIHICILGDFEQMRCFLHNFSKKKKKKLKICSIV